MARLPPCRQYRAASGKLGDDLLFELSGAAVPLSDLTGVIARIMDGQGGNGAYPNILTAEDVQSSYTFGFARQSGNRSLPYYTQLEATIKNLNPPPYSLASGFVSIGRRRKSSDIHIDQTLVSFCSICLALARSCFKQIVGLEPTVSMVQSG